jgi:hypothetical protein
MGWGTVDPAVPCPFSFGGNMTGPKKGQDPIENEETFDENFGTDEEGEFPLDLPPDHPDYEEEK